MTRRIGGTTIRSIGDISRRQSIADDDDEFVDDMEMMRRLEADNRQVAERQRMALEKAEEAGDHPTAGLLEGFIDETEKRIWFLYESRQGGASQASGRAAIRPPSAGLSDAGEARHSQATEACSPHPRG
jgi:starvation-inducible DNA-binding protein